MDHFELVSEYAPTGDQPQAIDQLVKGFKEGNQCETLLGVTGSGKTFTMANVIAQLNNPTLIKLITKPWRLSYMENSKNSFRIMPWNILSPTTTITNRKPTFRLPTPTLPRTHPSTMRQISYVFLLHPLLVSEKMSSLSPACPASMELVVLTTIKT